MMAKKGSKRTTGRSTQSRGGRSVRGANGSRSRPPQPRELPGPLEHAPAPTPLEPPAGPTTAPFPIVGIGASAGGLEALEQFLRNVPDKSGMAFVVVQHLDPEHKGSLVALLQRASSMP